MSEQEKAKRIEELLPTVEAIIEEYRAQGRELTRQAFEKYAGICFITKEIAPWVRGGAEKS